MTTVSVAMNTAHSLKICMQWKSEVAPTMCKIKISNLILDCKKLVLTATVTFLTVS